MTPINLALIREQFFYATGSLYPPNAYQARMHREINSNEETGLPTGSALFDSITQCHIGAAVVFM